MLLLQGRRFQKFAVSTLVICFLCSRTLCAKGNKRRLNGGHEDEEITEDFANLSSNDEYEEPVPRRVDPQGSWFAFVRHSDRSNKKHNNKNKEKRRKALKGLTGPRGPQGPPGPPGPSGAVLTKEVMMEEFKEMVREAAESRAEKLMAQRCPSCPVKTNSSYILPIHDIDELNIIPRITSGFHVRLRNNAKVSRRTFQELKTFHVPFAGGSFQRGNSFDDRGGRFTAPREGIYQFTANLHLQLKHKKKHKILKPRDNIRVLICINSLCQKHTSLEFISGIESNSRIYTVSLVGVLHLRAQQYVSVHVDNASGMSIIVHTGSDFTGILLGV